jgi:hypothetical protein
MIDLKNETPLSLTAAARLLPAGRSGRPVSLSCIFRWISDGVLAPDGQRVRLEAARAGGRWITSVEAIQRFMEKQTPRFDEPATTPRTPGRRQRDDERTAKKLDLLGI